VGAIVPSLQFTNDRGVTMTLFARSDVQAVALGGVDHTHRRPLRKDGTPVRRWGLDCDVCEGMLDDDNLWSKQKHKIPLTEEEEQEIKDLNDAANAAMERERIAAAKALAEGVGRRRESEEDEDEDDDPVDPDDDKNKQEQDPPAPAVVINYAEINYNDLNKLAKERGLEMGGKKDELVKRLEQHDAELADQPAE
jgi:hypothetical protein